jgi:ABC-type phosphate/phosphonate transport system permease subunit
MTTVAWLVLGAFVVFAALLLTVLDVWAATDNVPQNTLSANLRRLFRRHRWVRPLVFALLFAGLVVLWVHLR